MRFIIILCGLFFAFSFTGTANAQNKLTPENIQAFLNESSAMTHPETGANAEGITNYLEDHIDRRAAFISHIIYDIDGFPPQERKFELDRKAFIQNITDGIGKIKDYSSFAKLISHDINNVGRSAEIVVVTSEKGLMPMQDQMVPFDGKTRCSQVLGWERKIVVKSANCETILTISQPEEDL